MCVHTLVGQAFERVSSVSSVLSRGSFRRTGSLGGGEEQDTTPAAEPGAGAVSDAEAEMVDEIKDFLLLPACHVELMHAKEFEALEALGLPSKTIFVIRVAMQVAFTLAAVQ